MDRTACVDVPALPLQLLLQRYPDWASQPAVVVDRDKPQGVILWANPEALRNRILPGMRYAAGLSLIGTLRAGEVSAGEIRAGVSLLTERLRRFSPDVEPAAGEPGVFWLDASGLGRLYASGSEWARGIRSELSGLNFESQVVLGFTKFGTYARAKAGTREGASAFRTPAEERAAALKTPLERLGVDPKLRDELEKLGARTVGKFLELPAGGVRQRFGAEAHRLHALASGASWDPLEAVPAEEPLVRSTDLDTAESDAYRLLFLVKRLLDPLLSTLASRREALAELQIRLQVDFMKGKVEERVERVRPAAPTLDSRQILNLVHLRLESLEYVSRGEVTGIELTASPARVPPEQLGLFADRPKRDLGAADRALARVRSEFGREAVVGARLREGHLPEARFEWEPLAHVVLPRPKEALMRPLVRRIYSRPLPLPAREHREPDGWLLVGEACGPVDDFLGPYLVSGGWWNKEVHREYYFARRRTGELLWVYYDRPRRRWFLQGRVE